MRDLATGFGKSDQVSAEKFLVGIRKDELGQLGQPDSLERFLKIETGTVNMEFLEAPLIVVECIQKLYISHIVVNF